MTLLYNFYRIKSMENYKDIQYSIKYTSRKNSIALVFLSTHAEIRAPRKTNIKTIEKFLEKNYELILQKIENSTFATREYVQGEEFLIAGETYKLNIVLSKVNEVIAQDGIINLYVKQDDFDLKKELLDKYYTRIAQTDIKRLVMNWSKQMDLYPNKVKLNRAEKRWGSCNYSTKTLNFTIRNAMLPDWVQEYIVIHELSHLVHPNHSAKFWNFVETFMPDYKQAEKYLRVNSSLLTL